MGDKTNHHDDANEIIVEVIVSLPKVCDEDVKVVNMKGHIHTLTSKRFLIMTGGHPLSLECKEANLPFPLMIVNRNFKVTGYQLP